MLIFSPLSCNPTAYSTIKRVAILQMTCQCETCLQNKHEFNVIYWCTSISCCLFTPTYYGFQLRLQAHAQRYIVHASMIDDTNV